MVLSNEESIIGSMTYGSEFISWKIADPNWYIKGENENVFDATNDTDKLLLWNQWCCENYELERIYSIK